MSTTPENMLKYENYKKMHDDLNKAMRDGFYYQAIFIEYAILEDRLTSVLKHSGVPYQNKKGRDINITEKIDRISQRAELASDFVQKRLSPELMTELREWLIKRNTLIHNLANIPFDDERIRDIANQGADYCRIIKSKSESINHHMAKIKSSKT